MTTPGTLVTPNVRLSRLLGKGGMGSVWVADDLALEREVAVKFINEVDASDEARARFELEAKSAARIKSPHVVQIFDYGVAQDGHPFIIMELLEGEDLCQRMARGPMTPAELAPILMQAATGLAAAHATGVVHRDIKPPNIFLVATPSGVPFVKVLDFGIAKFATPPGSVGSSAPLTQTGTVVGSPEYMSPEQLRSQDGATLATDIWALGVVAYEALTRQRPFGGDTLISLSLAICEGHYDAERIPVALRPWFQRALSTRPEYRFGSAIEAAESFAALASEPTGAPMVMPRAAAPQPGGLRLGRGVVFAAAGVAFVVGAAIVVAAVSSARSDDVQAETRATAPGSGTAAPQTVAAAPASVTATKGGDVEEAPAASTSSQPPSAPATAARQGPPRQAPVAAQCKKPCSDVGACGLIDGSCYPRSDADCRQAYRCKAFGACTSSGGQCKPSNDADCAASSRCASYGNCGFGAVCHPKTDAHCRQSANCAERGLCALSGKSCAPGSNADCQASSRCAKMGHCLKKGGTCSKTAQ